MGLVDTIAWSLLSACVIAFIVVFRSYSKGLKGSPRDLWLLFLYHMIEYSAYGAMSIAMILWLSRDCGLGDVAAGSYIAGWSIMLSVIALIAGALVDTVGIRRTLIISTVFLLISRLSMSLITNPFAVFVGGFVPLAIGFAIVGPLVSVAIKRYCTNEGAALGFGLFYVIINVAYAIGGFFFDWIRGFYGQRDATGKIVDENFGTVILGNHFSTYQMIFIFGLIATALSLVVSFLIRDGVERFDNGTVVIRPRKECGNGLKALGLKTKETGMLIGRVVLENYFWVYIGLLSLTLFVRFIFFHFQYTFPKYGIRILGEGAMIGSIFGVLNPVLIVFLVPLVAFLTKKISSYRVMITGASVSSLACFIFAIPAQVFAPLTNSVLGQLIFVKWLGLAETAQELVSNRASEYWPMIAAIAIFTVGEAIWSPRLMQFTAEMAPKGKEGTYIALSVLPWFAAKFVVGPLSGILLNTYVPAGEGVPPQGLYGPLTEALTSTSPDGRAPFAAQTYPDHGMIWIWIGGMALTSPVGLLLFRGWFHKQTAARQAAEAAEAEESSKF